MGIRRTKMKTNYFYFTKLLNCIFTAVILFVSGCSGGGGGSTVASSGGSGGIGGTGVSFGSVDGFASIILNGVEFATGGATFTINDAVVVESDLEVGQVVRAEVNFGAQTTTQVDYAETVRGPIQAINLVNRKMTVLNQRIVVTDETSFFNNVLFENLVVGNEIEISGIRDAAGVVVASYIRLRNGTAEYRVIGWVENLNAAANTFEIRGPAPRLVVDFSVTNQFQTGAIANGRLIEVIGPDVFVPNTFNAARIEDGLELNAIVGDDVEVEGIISVFNSIANFEVNGQVVNASGATLIFEDGTAAAVGDFALNVKVEVEGAVVGGNVLQASRVIIKLDNFIRITANADSVNLGAQTLTLLGETIRVVPTTRFEDKSAADLPQFGLDDIMSGNYIEMRGSFIGPNVVAIRIEREDPDTEVELQGIVEAVGANTVTILGNTLVVDAGTQYFNENDMAINAMTFFAAISNGSVVKAQWDPFGAINLPVDEFEIEDL